MCHTPTFIISSLPQSLAPSHISWLSFRSAALRQCNTMQAEAITDDCCIWPLNKTLFRLFWECFSLYLLLSFCVCELTSVNLSQFSFVLLFFFCGELFELLHIDSALTHTLCYYYYLYYLLCALAYRVWFTICVTRFWFIDINTSSGNNHQWVYAFIFIY